MMRPSAFMTLTALAFLSVCAVIGFYHFKADRWGVFATDYQSFHQRIIVNKLYLKTHLLLNTEHEYDCYLFGSSRVAAIDARHFGEHCYNFTHSAGLVADHVRTIEIMLEAGLPVRDIYIALDDLSYNENPEDGPIQHMRRGYPLTIFESFGFASLFLLKPPDFTDVGIFTGRLPKVETPRYIIDPNKDTDRIRERYQKFIDEPEKTDVRMRRLSGMAEGDVYYGDASIEALARLNVLSEEHGIRVHLFFLPLHYKTYVMRNYEWFSKFKRDVAELSPYYDFSGLNEYTLDNRHWRETSHFSALLGDRIAGVINDGESAAGSLASYVDQASYDQSEQRKLEQDVSYLPLAARREGALPLKERFIRHWHFLETLEPVAMAQIVDSKRSTFDLTQAAQVKLGRESEVSGRAGKLELDLRRGDYFVLEYDFNSHFPEALRWQMEQDAGEYEGKIKEFKLRVLPGRNNGQYVGYASVDSPELRVVLGGGDLEYDWRPLRVWRLRPNEDERRLAESYTDHYLHETGEI